MGRGQRWGVKEENFGGGYVRVYKIDQYGFLKDIQTIGD